jgi:hypothetical protein
MVTARRIGEARPCPLRDIVGGQACELELDERGRRRLAQSAHAFVERFDGLVFRFTVSFN